jgi:N-acetylglucosaminyldiphosphoundecaprenol N-acetyl-beta-D-mannosaminyltransferase
MLASEAPSLPQFNAQGFELWYQPIYDIHDGTVLYNEVLLRWRNTAGQLYRPHDFMSRFTHGQYPGWLDRVVVQKAIQTLVAYPQLSLSINLSDQVYQDSAFVDHLHAQLTHVQVHPHQLHFELAEQSIAQNLADAIALIRDLKTIGCAVILDGFSNEYLTFLNWERLNVSSIKIDGHLIEAAHESWQQSQLTQTIIETSDLFEQSAGAKSIDARSSAALHRLSFDSAQGYHFKPPSRQPWQVGKIDILGVPMDNLSQQDLFAQLTAGVVCATNIEQIINLRRDPALAQSYRIADYQVCDRNAILFSSRQLGQPIAPEHSHVFPAFCTYHRANPNITLFLLGGDAKASINQQIGRQMILETCTPSLDFEHNEQECREIVACINRSGATVLAMAVGSPRQEQWIQRYRDQLSTVKIIFALESTAAFEAAAQSPAKRGWGWLQQRMIQPERFWQDDLPFLGLLLQQTLS